MFLSVLSVILYTAAVLIALILIALVLVQPSKGGGFGAAFGGVGEGVFGAQTMGVISKITVYFIVAFFVITLALASLSGYTQKTTAAAQDSAALLGLKDAPATNDVKETNKSALNPIQKQQKNTTSDKKK